jgi:agmatine/peptidylarginine deiminase
MLNRILLISIACCILITDVSGQVITTPPQMTSMRAMAEWEEVDALTIAWVDYPSILKQIVAAARLEAEVIILTEDQADTEDYLLSNNSGGEAFSDLNNITILETNLNSIWLRDYAANPVYGNEVDSLFLVDWMYNRPRPDDDASPEVIADYLGLDLYATSEAPYELLNTGGNYMSDGFGTAFASELILEENDGDGDYNIYYPVQSEQEINNIMQQFMGIDTYIKMNTLPYDGIHHIDMHMKLIDEETILVGEFPEGVSDGPQINANIEYVLSNYTSKFGTPFDIVRIPMPSNTSGEYPGSGASYRTYTNAVFVNNTIIFPTYREEYDTTAYRIWGEVCPGYNLVGIDCDNQGANIISLSGAIHCITHTVGVQDPLLISHQPLDDTYETILPYNVSAYLNHRDGIASASVFWRLNGTETWNELAMTDLGDNIWAASIPAQAVGAIVEYYIRGEAVSGKVQFRPMPAPDAYWTFQVLGEIVGAEEIFAPEFSRVFPNPASAITCIELKAEVSQSQTDMFITDLTGRRVMDVYNGIVPTGTSKYFLDASRLAPGIYSLNLTSAAGTRSLNLMVK